MSTINMNMSNLSINGIQNPKKELKNFLEFCASELNLDKIPPIIILNQPISSGEYNSFAAYSLSKKAIYIYIKNRHILDICRSLAHELVHYRQDLNNVLTAESGKTGSEHENEANATAGKLLRQYGKDRPELF